MEKGRYIESLLHRKAVYTAYIVYIMVIDRLSVFDLIQCLKQKVIFVV